MRQRTLGPDGPAAGAIGFGALHLSISENRPSEADAIRLLHHAADLGMTLWDTADAYYCFGETEPGHNERILAKAYAALPADMRDRVLIATKGGHTRPGGGWVPCGRPEYLRTALDASLKALNTDHIDLYQLHHPDDTVPFADAMGVFAEAYQAGKIRTVGLSNVSAAQIDEAMPIVPIVSVQNQYNPSHRHPERDGVLDKCRVYSLAFFPWCPLGGVGGAKGLGKAGVLADVAGELEISPQRVILAWMLGKYERLIAIPGASRIESVNDSAKADEVVLTAEQAARLDAGL